MADFKQVIAVRTDLGMGKGKIAAQVGHACVMAADKARRNYSDWYDSWWPSQAKIVVRASGISDIIKLKRSAAEMDIPWAEVSDAGHTQLEPGTVTCICLGPADGNRIDDITGDMRLL